MGGSVQRLLFATAGVTAIVAGLVIYAALRPTRVALIPDTLHFGERSSPPDAVLGALPSFMHAFAMPLLTLACLRHVRRVHVIATCLAWFAIDALFELGQTRVHSLLPAGTFDPLDILGAALGATLAAVVASAVTGSKR